MIQNSLLFCVCFSTIVVAADKAEEFSYKGVGRLYKLAHEKLGEGSDRLVEWLIGKSLVEMSK